MKILYDTNIFIDALNSTLEQNAFEKIFQTQHKLYVTIGCFGELSSAPVIGTKSQKDFVEDKIEAGKISCLIPGQEIIDLSQEIRRRNSRLPSIRRISRVDSEALATVLYLHLDNMATLDKNLRDLSNLENIFPLWLGDIFKFLVDSGKMTKNEALDICNTIYAKGIPTFVRGNWPYDAE